MNYQSQKISNLNLGFEVKNFYSILGLYIFSLGSLVGGFSFYLLLESTGIVEPRLITWNGQGLFWFNLSEAPVFNVLCQRGDLISVPSGTKHWFDAGKDAPFVKAIRIFTDMSGWIPHYTSSGIEDRYQNFKAPDLG